MVKKAAHNHEVAELKSFKAWKPGMKTKRRVVVKDEEGNVKLNKKGKPDYEIHYVPISADKKSQMNHLHMSANVQRHYGVLWNQADKCPLFRQDVPKVKNAKGEMVHRTYPNTDIPITERSNRALSGHTLKTLASGAVAAVNAQLHADATTLRLQTKNGEPLAPEDAKYPMLPQISVGAAAAIEAAFVAYVQEIFSTALDIQKAHENKHGKVTAKCCQAAADIVNKRLAAASSFVPETVSFRKAPKQKKGKAAEEGTEQAAAKEK
jgi:hypothetical protein